MKWSFYPKLAWNGIKKNKKLYVPYILTCIGMIMMNYIIAFLSGTPALKTMPGARTIAETLGMSWWIISLFALFFLFYSNSFLMRRRKKEFGLYNILGMGKRNISKILFCEFLIIAIISLVLGLAIGVALSKLFELGLMNIMKGQVSYDFTVFPDTMQSTAFIFLAIFFLLFLNGLRQISFSNPMELVRSEIVGEKPPKANWFIGFVGLVLLVIAYYIALTIQSPINALAGFFVAVALVIVATYLLFGFGSVVLCRLLQKKKQYYYKTNHFIAISSMTYRMNRNGAGLASICILLTMVFVMISATATLYIGAEDMIRIRYPMDINLKIRMQSMEYMNEQTFDLFRDKIQVILEENKAQVKEKMDYPMIYTEGIFADGVFYNNEDIMQSLTFETASEAVVLYIVPLSDYNRIMGKEETLEENEVLVYSFRMEYIAPTFQMNDDKVYIVKEVVNNWINNGDVVASIFPTIYMFVNDLDTFTIQDREVNDSAGIPRMKFEWMYAFDLDISKEEQINICHQIKQTDWIRGLEYEDMIYSSQVEGQEDGTAGFYYLFGGLFYIGILLSIVFLVATVLIIYYKQISEGYEDQKRFEIMQKIGMTKKDIRKSINSQMLTVFFLPLLMAGIHLCFAFPIICKILLMFNLQNIMLMIGTTIVCFLIFSLFYTIVYKMTSNVYFAIVSDVN